ncbi:MAG TPA: acetolactate synthase small subunit [Acidobacteriota bacterium]|jgi:acetolactate synthase-1/3 small subunit|nr:acetolactate synthase small subunit [Acidobacteriota bacterium]
MLHTLVAYVEDKPGVLNRVASLFRRRAFNIESLTVGHTERPGVSRMTIVIDSDQTSAVRVEQNLYKLVNVLRVEDLANVPSVLRDLALIKVKADAEMRPKILQLAEVFRARPLDVGTTTLILEVTGSEDKIEALLNVLRPFGIVEMVRTGTVAMVRGEGSIDAAQIPGWASS